jgi:hypothetical protein
MIFMTEYGHALALLTDRKQRRLKSMRLCHVLTRFWGEILGFGI